MTDRRHSAADALAEYARVADTRLGGVDWVIVVPFKGAPHGKSRLAAPIAAGGSFESSEQASGSEAGFSPSQRAELALAFLHDTVAAARRADGVVRVVIVSSARELEASDWPHGAATALEHDAPVEIVADPELGLNAAFEAGARVARERHPRAGVAALTGDLPVVRASDLQRALTLAAKRPRGVVADRAGTGTTLVTVRPGVPFTPRFGGGSFAAHRASGHEPLEVEADSPLHFDIDSASDLREAATRSPGLGVETRALVGSLMAAQLERESPRDETDHAEHERNQADE